MDICVIPVSDYNLLVCLFYEINTVSERFVRQVGIVLCLYQGLLIFSDCVVFCFCLFDSRDTISSEILLDITIHLMYYI